MNPPWSMIFFTTLAGAGQGLFLALAVLDAATRLGHGAPPALFVVGAGLVMLLCGVGLGAAVFHLGHPLRAWRAAAMWRTSWLSREVIALPVFMAVVLAWGLAYAGWAPLTELGPALALTGVALALALYVCTGMIYAAVAAIREWATPWTPLSFGLNGLASGLLGAAALAAALAPAAAAPLARAALLVLLAAALVRAGTVWRNRRLVARTTVQTAIGVRHPRIVQTAQGAMGGTFNTREFFHGRSPAHVRRMRALALLLGGLLPAVALWSGVAGAAALGALFALQWLGLLADRWLFFADARHPQNLYSAVDRGRPK